MGSVGRKTQQLHGYSCCLGTLQGTRDPMGKGTPQRVPLDTGISKKAIAGQIMGMSDAGLREETENCKHCL